MLANILESCPQLFKDFVLWDKLSNFSNAGLKLVILLLLPSKSVGLLVCAVPGYVIFFLSFWGFQSFLNTCLDHFAKFILCLEDKFLPGSRSLSYVCVWVLWLLFICFYALCSHFYNGWDFCSLVCFWSSAFLDPTSMFSPQNLRLSKPEIIIG
jgi:hypothetical protein